MAAALLKLGYLSKKIDERAPIERKIRLYFLYTAFGRRYGEGAPNKMKQDYEALTNWITIGKVVNKEGKADNVFKSVIEWKYEDLKKLPKSDHTSVSNAIRCLFYHKHPTDLLTNNVVKLDTKNQHHLFPEDYYKGQFGSVDSIFNIAYIEAETNNKILNHSIPDYSLTIAEKVGESTYRNNLKSHYIEGETLDAFISEDYPKFIKLRSEAIKNELITAYGAEVIDVEGEGGESGETEEEDE